MEPHATTAVATRGRCCRLKDKAFRNHNVTLRVAGGCRWRVGQNTARAGGKVAPLRLRLPFVSKASDQDERLHIGRASADIAVVHTSPRPSSASQPRIFRLSDPAFVTPRLVSPVRAFHHADSRCPSDFATVGGLCPRPSPHRGSSLCHILRRTAVLVSVRAFVTVSDSSSPRIFAPIRPSPAADRLGLSAFTAATAV